MKKICKNCKYWGIDYDSVCSKIGEWDGMAVINVTSDDDSGLVCNFKTNENFGCKEFKQK